MFLGLTVLDYLLILLLLSYAVTGYRQGLVVSVLSLAGFLTGGALAMWLLPMAIGAVDRARVVPAAARRSCSSPGCSSSPRSGRRSP